MAQINDTPDNQDEINPEFDFEKSNIGITASDILNEVETQLKSYEPIRHN